MANHANFPLALGDYRGLISLETPFLGTGCPDAPNWYGAARRCYSGSCDISTRPHRRSTRQACLVGPHAETASSSTSVKMPPSLRAHTPINGSDRVEWIRSAMDAPLLIVEIGAGFNTPGVVRWPLERLARTHPDARFVRMTVSTRRCRRS